MDLSTLKSLHSWLIDMQRRVDAAEREVSQAIKAAQAAFDRDALTPKLPDNAKPTTDLVRAAEEAIAAEFASLAKGKNWFVATASTPDITPAEQKAIHDSVNDAQVKVAAGTLKAKKVGAISEMKGNPLVEDLLKTVPQITQEAWVAAYGASHVNAECLKALAWMTSNPKHQKKHIGKFLSNWLSRSPSPAAPSKPGIVLGKDDDQEWP